MDPIRAVIAMITWCWAMVSPVVSAVLDPAHAPSEEYVYAVDGVLCTVTQCMIDDDLDISMCCVRAIHTEFPYRKKTPAATSTTPDALSSADIKAGLAVVRGRIDGCRERHSRRDRHGAPVDAMTVRVRARVTAEGAITDVTVTPRDEDAGEARDPALERCVVTAIERARLPKSQTGVTFSYLLRL